METLRNDPPMPRRGHAVPPIRALFILLSLIATIGAAAEAASQSMQQADGWRWVHPTVVNLRAAGGTEFDAIGQLHRGDRVWLVYVENGWAEIQVPTEEGWAYGFVRSDLLSETPPAIPLPPRPKPAAAGDVTPSGSRGASRAESPMHPGLPGAVLLAFLALIMFLVWRAGARCAFESPSGIARFQNRGERRLSRLLDHYFGPPDYHLMNHVTLQLGTGTTQIDHILVSRFGVFVIETKDYKGWIFGSPEDRLWTQVLHRRKFQFQNPIRQNTRHVRAVRTELDFLPAGAVKSIVAFVGPAELKTPMPEYVVYSSEIIDYIDAHCTELLTFDALQRCIRCLETARLAVTAETDFEHRLNVERWHTS